MRRTAGIVFGLGTHVLFAFTVWHLFWFLKGGVPPADTAMSATAGALTVGALAIDALFAAAFAVPHSILLLPAVRKKLVASGIASPFYGCFYCVATCVALLTTIVCWQPVALVVWRWPASGGPREGSLDSRATAGRRRGAVAPRRDRLQHRLLRAAARAAGLGLRRPIDRAAVARTAVAVTGLAHASARRAAPAAITVATPGVAGGGGDRGGHEGNRGQGRPQEETVHDSYSKNVGRTQCRDVWNRTVGSHEGRLPTSLVAHPSNRRSTRPDRAGRCGSGFNSATRRTESGVVSSGWSPRR